MSFVLTCLLYTGQLLPQPDNSTNSDISVFDNENQDGDSYEEFIEYEGKTISQINIKIINVSGPSIEEDQDFASSFIGDIGNKLHFKSRTWVVRNMLLFSEGDTVDAQRLSESERLLRNSGFFLDARLKISNSSATDSIIINVITKDRWTLTPQFSYNSRTDGFYFGIKDDNFLGLGHIINATGSYDSDPLLRTGGNIRYTAVNVAGTFINAGTHIEANKSFTVKNLSFTRPYLSTELEWAGGLDLTLEQGRYEFYNYSEGTRSYYYNNNGQDVWIGKTFPMWFGPGIFKNRSKVFAAARAARINFTHRPSIIGNTQRLFENNVLYLFSAGIINQRFYKDIYLNSFGITEDVPVGGLFSITSGTEKRESNSRWYAGIDLLYSTRVNNAGYFSGRLKIDGFRNINRWEQRTINFNFLYHSPLITKNKWKFRFLLNHDQLYGFNRFEGEQIYLDAENGLRGINTFSLFGTKRILLNSEAMVFSPYSLLGFKIGGMAFADFGLISGKEQGLFKSKFYQAYGAGFRINNESIARAGLNIALVYNPILLNGPGHFKILFTGSFVLGSRTFGFEKPSVITFNSLR